MTAVETETAKRPRRPAARLDHTEVAWTPAIAVHGFRWHLPDEWESEVEPGRVLKLMAIVRVEGLYEYGTGVRWKLELLGVERVCE